MNNSQDHRLSLKVDAAMQWLPAVTQCVETAAAFFGLGRNETLKLCLAAEEIFSYLSSRVCGGAPLEVRCLGSLFYARIEFHFSVSRLNMAALNMTTAVASADEENVTEIGLVIASRTIDRLYISTGMNNTVILAVEQDKAYPSLADRSPLPVESRGKLTVATPGAEAIKRFASQVGICAPDPLRPSFLDYPGKVADMVTSGYCQALVAQDAAGTVAGGLLYRLLTGKMVEIFTPCMFDPRRTEEIAGLLVEACIAQTARTKAVGLVSLSGLPASAQPQFEKLGMLTYTRKNGPPLSCIALCRLLHEDPGCQVWTNPSLKPYLDGEYDRLFLARDIRVVDDMGDTRSGPSIFAMEIRRERLEAYLRPLWPGEDFAENLSRHVDLCKKEGLINIFFAVDLGISWNALLAPILISQAFKPRVMIPFAGQADLVIFQYDESES